MPSSQLTVSKKISTTENSKITNARYTLTWKQIHAFSAFNTQRKTHMPITKETMAQLTLFLKLYYIIVTRSAALQLFLTN